MADDRQPVKKSMGGETEMKLQVSGVGIVPADTEICG